MTNLKRILELRGMTVTELGKLTGIPVNTLFGYHQGRTDINKIQPRCLVSMAKVLNCKITNLLTDKQLIDDLKKYL